VTGRKGSGGSHIGHLIERIAEFGGLGLAVFLVGVVVGGAIVFTLHETHALPSTCDGCQLAGVARPSGALPDPMVLVDERHLHL
jgi:hypothetical protein